MENNTNLPRAPRGFEELMTRREALAAAIYLPVHAVLLPLLPHLPRGAGRDFARKSR